MQCPRCEHEIPADATECPGCGTAIWDLRPDKKTGSGPWSAHAGKARETGIRTAAALLRAGATPEGRKELEERTGIDRKLILGWIGRADLMRIRGVGEAYSDLLDSAGVDTVAELAQRNPDNLFNKLLDVNAGERLVRRMPNREKVAGWVEQARTLPKIVSY
jgi:predicted flap endonuclease-1-like 5' DNA nuclease